MVEIWKDCELGQTYKEKTFPDKDAANAWLEENERFYDGWHLRMVEIPETSITLTNVQWARLNTFLLMTTNFRKEELDSWRKLARERDEAGRPSFPNAVNQATFWRETIEVVDQVRRAIDAAV